MLDAKEKLQVFALYHKAPIAIFDDKEMPLRGVSAEIERVHFDVPAIISEHSVIPDFDKIKLILKQIQYMSDIDLYNYCYAYDNIPFVNTRPAEWWIEKESDVFKVRHKSNEHSYSIDKSSGNIQMYRLGKTSSLGNQAYAVQWLIKNNYAVPIYFERGHEANGKSPFELKLAIPDRGLMTALLMKIYDNNNDMVADWFDDKLYYNIDLGEVKIFDEYIAQLQKQSLSL